VVTTGLLPLAAGLLSLLGSGDAAPLPRSLADEVADTEGVPSDLPEDIFQEPAREAKPPDGPPPGLSHDSLGGFFQSHADGRAWRESVWEEYLTEPPVLVPIGLGVAAAGVSHGDQPLYRRMEGTLGGRVWIGNVTMATLVAGSLALGILAPGEGRNGWDNLWEEAEVLGVTGLVTTSLKFIVDRTRPAGGNRSFPSGHSATAFASACLIDDNSGLAFGVPAYGLASLTGYSRIESGQHYPSDVLAGAAIGILTAQILDHLHGGRGGKTPGTAGGGLRLELEPLDRGGMAGCSFRY